MLDIELLLTFSSTVLSKAGLSCISSLASSHLYTDPLKLHFDPHHTTETAPTKIINMLNTFQLVCYMLC